MKGVFSILRRHLAVSVLVVAVCGAGRRRATRIVRRARRERGSGA